MMENFDVVEIGKRNMKAPNHWELLDLNNLEFNKPIILCFSGNGTIRNGTANGFAKGISSLLDLMFKSKKGRDTLTHLDLMSVKYACTGFDGGKLTAVALEQLTDALLKLCVGKDGKRLQLDQAQRNVARLTFCTFSAGNSVLHQVFQRFDEKLGLVGYGANEIKAINHATLEVSFAPENNAHNFIPSVRVISLKDKVVGDGQLEALKSGGVLTTQQAENLNGIYLHQDKPGYLYGVAHEQTAPASSIQIISSCLLNSYDRPGYGNDVDEHEISLIARNKDWDLKPTMVDGVAYQSQNADCVSQMMAWALCKGVENSLQNFQAPKYVPNIYWQELMGDFKSIINSYGQKQLTKNPIRERVIRKHNYEKLINQNSELKMPTFEDMVNRLNNASSLTDAINYLQQNNFVGIEFILPEVQVLTPAEKNDILVLAGKKNLVTTPQEIELGK